MYMDELLFKLDLGYDFNESFKRLMVSDSFRLNCEVISEDDVISLVSKSGDDEYVLIFDFSNEICTCISSSKVSSVKTCFDFDGNIHSLY